MIPKIIIGAPGAATPWPPEPFFFLLIAIAVFFAAELLLMLLVKYLRKDFQWLIQAEDETPVLDSEGLKKFFANGYDPELGWIRRPDTEHEERGKHGPTGYHIDSQGIRCSPGNEEWEPKIACFGDSFTFSRQVNDDETWPHHLAHKTQSRVLNFGVGNYGLDQAFLRMKRELNIHRPGVVIMGVVPSTIVRILCVWKHYNEYGNTFAFKPRFKLENQRLTLVPNVIDQEEKFAHYEQYLDTIRSNDYFYESKFRHEMIRFPYLFHTLRNPGRNVPLIKALLFKRLFNAIGIHFKRLDDYPLMKIMRINLKLRYDLYKDPYAQELFMEILDLYRDFAQQAGITPVFLFMPQKDDILFIKKKGHYYKKFMQQVNQKMPTFDLTDALLAVDDIDALYSDDNVYGGHFCRDGNRWVAGEVYKFLDENNIL